MARTWASDVQYKAVIVYNYAGSTEKTREMQGPYDKKGTAESQLTRMWKQAIKYGGEHKTNLTGWIEEGKVEWTVLPNKDARALTKLINLEEELWNE